MWIILFYTWGICECVTKEYLVKDGETQDDLVSYLVKTHKSTQDSTNWSIDKSTCEHRWSEQCGIL
jgi:hypothetical protein